MPRLLWQFRKPFLRKDRIYHVYNNIRIKIDPDTNFHWLNVVNYGGYEAVLLFEKFLRPGDIYVDIGSNYGYMAINAKKLVGDAGRVIAIEPEPKAQELLRFNAGLNNAGIDIVQKAISHSGGTGVFNVATETGLSRLDNLQKNTFGMILREKMEVQKITLDDLLADLAPGQQVRLVKMDVEGHELNILRGAGKLLARRDCIFMLEINHGALSQNDTTLKDILDFFTSHAYKVFWVHSHSADWFRIGRMPTLEEAKDHQKFSGIYADILAVADNQVSDLSLIKAR